MRIAAFTGVLLGMTASVLPCRGQAYAFTELPALPAGTLFQNPAAIALDGTILSTAYTKTGAGLMLQRGTQSHFITIDIPGHPELSPVAGDLTLSRRIVGSCTDDKATTSIGFVREPSGSLRTYSVPGYGFTSLSGTSFLGVSVGSASTDGFSDNAPIIAFGNQAHAINLPGLSGYTGFQDINDFGEILGFTIDPTTFDQTQFLIDIYGFHPIQIPQAFSSLLFLHINNLGQAVGYGQSADDPSVQHGVIRNAGGEVHIVDWSPTWAPTLDVTLNGEPVHLTFSSQAGTTLLAINDRRELLASATAAYEGHFSNGTPLLYFDTKNGIGRPH